MCIKNNASIVNIIFARIIFRFLFCKKRDCPPMAETLFKPI